MELNEIYEYDDGLLMNKAGHIYYNMDKDGYIRVRRAGKEYRAHRLIWELFNGPIPEGMLIDHIDGDILNNRIENLRLATRQQNNVNSNGSGRYAKGVVLSNSNKFRARIKVDGVHMDLGSYDTEEEAAEAYRVAALEVHGEFAYEQ
jgi:hypothetical protein